MNDSQQDIVRRLREFTLEDHHTGRDYVLGCCEDAADEIERLAKENQDLKILVRDLYNAAEDLDDTICNRVSEAIKE